MGVVEDLRTMVAATPDQTGGYQCQGCHARFETQYHVCSDCGSYRVERTEWDISTSETV